MEKIKSLQSVTVKGKIVLVRVDFNVPIEDGVISDDTRILAALPTLKYLQETDARIVLMTHLGRPKGKKVKKYSLLPVVEKLKTIVKNTEIHFASDINDQGLKDKIHQMHPGEILVLENVRFYSGEEENSAAFSKHLAGLGDIFVNDAFSASHRAHASVVGITKYLPSYAGLLFFDELRNLDRFLKRPLKPLWAIIGGAKISTKLPLIKSLIDKVDGLIIGGAMANTLLLSQGKNIGASLVERDLENECKKIIAEAEKKKCTLLLPTDVVVAESPDAKNVQVKQVEDIENKDMILDVGPGTIEHIEKCLASAKTVIWNGPLGLIEVPPFEKGTEQVAHMLGKIPGVIKVSGGGDTVAILNKLKFINIFSYVSLAGGAFLEWLEGKELPGIKALTHKD